MASSFHRQEPGLKSQPAAKHRPFWNSDLALLIYIGLATVVVHLFTGRYYGFHRDELATLDDARHLSWGYVAYPPVTPFFGRLSLILFGTSLTGFRFFAAVAEAVAVVLTGRMAHHLGGRRGAQLLAAIAAVPFCLAGGALMQYVSFDYLFWVLTAYFTIRLLETANPRWWLAIGCAIGLGVMSKYSMPFLVVGLLVGMALTPARRYFAGKWFWYGVGLSVLIFLPNLVWQIQHHFIYLDFVHHIHARDIRMGRTRNFLPGQLEITLLALPLAVAGLHVYFFSPLGKRFRLIGWMYLIPMLLFIVLKGRVYYSAGLYPMLYAAGSVWGEQWLHSFRSPIRIAVRLLAYTALLLDIALAAAFFLPIAPVHSRWWNVAVSVNGDFRAEFGWQELVATVADIRNSLPASDQAHLGILAGNYGEAGAINLYGPSYGLPNAISGINSFWQRGYGNPPPQTLIVVGLSQRFLAANFDSCHIAGHTWNRYGVQNEETHDNPDIFVCRGLRESWPDFWRDFQYFG